MSIAEKIQDWLDTFVEPIIYQRGEDYFSKGNVKDLKKVGATTWTATVIGSQSYDVKFELEDQYVISMCDCPYPGDICKHQVAVAMTILHDLSGETINLLIDEEIPDDEKKLKDILESLTIDEIKGSLYRILIMDQELYDRFMLEHQPFPDDLRTIRRLVLKALRTGADRSGFVGYWQVRESFNAVRVILEQIQSMIDQNDIMHAFRVSRTVVIETIKALEYSDDSSGLLGGVIEDSIRYISECVRRCPEEDERKLFSEVLKLAQNPVFHGWDWHYALLGFLPFIILTESQRGKLESYLTELETETQKRTYPSSYAMLSILTIRHQLIELFDSYEASWEFVGQHLDVDHFRTLLIEKMLAEKNYKSAIQLCEEGIQLARTRYAQPLIGVVEGYFYLLLDIAERQNDEKAIEKYRLALLIECEEWQMYVVLQKAVAPEIWVKKRREIWKEMEQSKNPDMLAKAYDYEEQYGLLLEHCKRNRGLHSKYATSLEQNFPAYMANYYREEVYKEMETVQGGRSKYHAAAAVLKNVKRLGYERQFHQAIDDLCKKYPNRRAMIEELRKIE